MILSVMICVVLVEVVIRETDKVVSEVEVDKEIVMMMEEIGKIGGKATTTTTTITITNVALHQI